MTVRPLLLISVAALGAWALRETLRQRATSPRPVRQAGRAEMRDPPEEWDRVDERVDASFPASDPPGGY